MFGGFRIKPPKRLLLDVPREESCDEILGEAGRRSCAKRRTPQGEGVALWAKAAPDRAIVVTKAKQRRRIM
jgi:hypothetical protein